MTVALIAIFLLFFVGGPLLFRTLTKTTPSPHYMKVLIALTAGFAVAGLLARFAMSPQWGQNPWITAIGLLLIWFSWVGVLAFAALALRQKDPRDQMRRWTTIIGALGTTVPWFGLASASLMQG